MTNTPTDTPEAPSTEVEASPDGPPAEAGAETAEPTPFWQRPLVERFLVPLVLPIFVVVGLVAYVLNISRIFLAGHGHIPVIVGSIITGMILVGATLLSVASRRLRQSAVTLVGAAFVLAIMSSGWLVLGHSQPESTGPATLPTTLTAKQIVKVTAAPGGALAFSPNTISVKTGLVKFDVLIAAAGHTFSMHEANTLMQSLSLDAAGATDSTVAFFPEPGTYHFYCAVPGHEAQGMKGVINVTGSPTTLSDAVTAAGNPPGAAG